jgi:hypothetical protein
MHFFHRTKKLALAFLFFLPSLASAEESHQWLPVDSTDLQMKEFKRLPGAEAVLLYYADEIDDVSHSEFCYSRIKVLTDGGNQYANLEIPKGENTSVVDLFARTLHPDGKVVESPDRPFEMVVFRG